MRAQLGAAARDVLAAALAGGCVEGRDAPASLKKKKKAAGEAAGGAAAAAASSLSSCVTVRSVSLALWRSSEVYEVRERGGCGG